MKMSKQRCLRWLGLLGSLFILGNAMAVPVISAAAPVETTALPTSDAAEAAETGATTDQILGIIAIFTVTCGVTAFLVMRPTLKRLKAARTKDTETNSSDS